MNGKDRQENQQLERKTLSVEDAGKVLGLSRASAYAAAQTGDLPTIRIGRRLLVPIAAIERLLASV
jgi:excisionase family DNA binding protein